MENVVPILLGIFFVMFTIRLMRKFKTLEANGQITEGVIDIERSGQSAKTVIVRFQTNDGQWIKEPAGNAILSSFVKSGDTVLVFYYKEDPMIFMIRTKFTNLLLTVFALVGTLLIVTGLVGIAGN